MTDLREEGPGREGALADLRLVLTRSLPRGLSAWLRPEHPDFDTLLEDTIQKTLMRVLQEFETFEGRSRFTTWVQKIAVRLALNDLRRHRWRDVSLEALQDPEAEAGTPREFASEDPGPEARAERGDAMQRVQRVLAEELTARQRAALMAVGLEGVPMEEVARRMGTNRNALYKLLHDARRRLRHRLEEEGLSPDELLGMFSRE